MNTEFLKNAMECVAQYNEERFTIASMAELAPGVLAVYVLPSGYFTVFFDRHLWIPTETMVALWGEETLLPSSWEERNVGFLPTRDEGANNGNANDFELFMYHVNRYLVSDKMTWYNEPVLRAVKSAEKTDWRDTYHPNCFECGAPMNLKEEDLGSMRNHTYRCAACGKLETMDD
jgi:hypothetical protein